MRKGNRKKSLRRNNYVVVIRSRPVGTLSRTKASTNLTNREKSAIIYIESEREIS